MLVHEAFRLLLVARKKKKDKDSYQPEVPGRHCKKYSLNTQNIEEK